MTKIRKGILGGVSGKIGNVIGGNWKGIDYLRSVPANVTNSNSPLQMAQRLKFAAVLRFVKPLKEVFRFGFSAYAVKMTAYNAGFAYNYANALSGDYPDYEIDYSRALLTKGSLPGVFNSEITAQPGAKLKITWHDNTGEVNAQITDFLFLVVYNPSKGQAIIRLNVATRKDESVVADIPASYAGDTVQCFLGFTALNAALTGQTKDAVSDSSYAGSALIIS